MHRPLALECISLRSRASLLFSSCTYCRAYLAVFLVVALSAPASFAAQQTDTTKAIAPDATSIKMKASENSDDSLKSKSAKSSAKVAAPTNKEELSPDELADRIAKKMAELHKENERIRLQQTQLKKAATHSRQTHGAGMTTDTTLTHPTQWSYEGDGGPMQWGKIDPANAKCETGERQSPIDIRDGIRVDLEPVVFDYKPVRFNVVDNGHTIQVNLGAGDSITILGHRYDLVQFHFHKPSEEHIDGAAFDMVVHLVHKDADGKLVVLAVLIKQGNANKLVQTIWNNMPLEKNDTVQATGTIDMNQILPASRKYFTYMGSLTTPPCTEGVLWVVFKEPIELSQDQISIFSRMYPMNARPIQNSFGRLIKESN